jgi:[NiFe] hydrogenase diaphorase moiety small subunit
MNEIANRFQLDGEEPPSSPGRPSCRPRWPRACIIPHLCWHPDFPRTARASCAPSRSTVASAPACTIAPGRAWTSKPHAGAELATSAARCCRCSSSRATTSARRCEKSGNCTLQATAYELKMLTPHFDTSIPDRPVDASHPDVLLDFNRCIMCELCVRASRDVDGKNVFALAGRGIGVASWSSTATRAGWPTPTSPSPTAPPHLPGGRDPEKSGWASRCRSASAATTAQPISEQASAPEGRQAPNAARRPRRMMVETTDASAGPHRTSSRSPPCRWPAASAATCPSSTSTSAPAAARAGRVRPLAAHRHQALRPLRHRPHRGRLCNAENVHVLREFRKNCKVLVASAPAPSTAACRRSATTSTCATSCRGLPHRPRLAAGSRIPNDPELPLPLEQGAPDPRGGEGSTTSCPAARPRPTRSGPS